MMRGADHDLKIKMMKEPQRRYLTTGRVRLPSRRNPQPPEQLGSDHSVVAKGLTKGGQNLAEDRCRPPIATPGVHGHSGVATLPDQE